MQALGGPLGCLLNQRCWAGKGWAALQEMLMGLGMGALA